ncbi:Rho-related GTP-binding protein RhoF [Lonchura striata]|uniref:Rho-related GTP-binding protein RhoF n=1 Tax=Lonchura striata TaxID=40157 RepID=A0A218UMF4_9PASE|nr:Rho-related GTP-binding protein RhoF [Lonchura striata domestica]
MDAANGAVPEGAAERPRGPAAAPSGGKEVKVVVVGDGGCGKTSLLMVYAKGSFPEDRDFFIQTILCVSGQEDYDRLRPLSYQNTNVVLICYDVMNPTSYDNVAAKWYPEVNHFCRGVPLVLIGCKTDLRKDKEHLRKLRAAKQEPITYNQGEAACKEINAQIYLECSAKCRENIENVFKEATTIALSAMKKAKGHRKRKVCSVL